MALVSPLLEHVEAFPGECQVRFNVNYSARSMKEGWFPEITFYLLPFLKFKLVFTIDILGRRLNTILMAVRIWGSYLPSGRATIVPSFHLSWHLTLQQQVPGPSLLHVPWCVLWGDESEEGLN